MSDVDESAENHQHNLQLASCPLCLSSPDPIEAMVNVHVRLKASNKTNAHFLSNTNKHRVT